MRYFYNVEDQQYTNFFQASCTALQKNSFVDFKLSSEAIASLESVKASEIDSIAIDQLFAEKLNALRNTFPKLRLMYSGGIDSHTILDIAEKNQIQFDQIVIETNSINDDPYVNEEHVPALAYVSKYSQLKVIRPTLDGYKTFEDPYWFEQINGSHQICFRPVWDGLYLPKLTNMLNITGDDKPWIYVDQKGKYYWAITDMSYREEMGFDHCAFFLDHIFPQVAVKQALIAKRYLQEYYPNFRGLWIPDKQCNTKAEKTFFFNKLGRSPALSENLLMGSLGKKTPTWYSEKNQRAMQECIALGKQDIVENFTYSLRCLREKYKNHPNTLRLIGDHDFDAILRYGAVFMITDKGLRQVEDNVIKL